MQSTFSSVMRPVMSLGTVGCALFVVAAIVALRRWLGFEGIYGTLLPLMAALFLLLATIGELPPAWRNFCANWGHTASGIFIMVMLGSICYHWDVSAVWLFGIYQVVTTPAQVSGRVVDGLLQGAGLGFGVAPLVIAMVLVATVVVLRECRLSSSWGVELMRDQPTTERSRAVEERASLVRACSAIAARYGLSQREEEVLPVACPAQERHRHRCRALRGPRHRQGAHPPRVPEARRTRAGGAVRAGGDGEGHAVGGFTWPRSPAGRSATFHPHGLHSPTVQCPQ